MKSGRTTYEMWDDYGAWLVDRVGFRKKRYGKLMAKLHNVPFRFSIRLDESRASDGIRLRDEYALEHDLLYPKFGQDCSVLEMLVGLALRVEYEYIGDPKDEHPERFFWEMVENLFDMEHHWKQCTDDEFDDLYVDFVLNRWLSRSFRSNGEGSIFPLKTPIRNQRQVEIWSQMNAYLTERYPI